MTTEDPVQQYVHIPVEWSDSDSVRALARAQARMQRRRKMRVVTAGAISATAAAAALLLVFVGEGSGPSVPEDPRMAARGHEHLDRVVPLADGSQAFLTGDKTRIHVRKQSRKRVEIELIEGLALFSVKPDTKRPFEVSCGDVKASVLGTVFSISCAAEKAVVQVEHGAVAVSAQGHAPTVLKAGQAETFPTKADAPGPDTPGLAALGPAALGRDRVTQATLDPVNSLSNRPASPIRSPIQLPQLGEAASVAGDQANVMGSDSAAGSIQAPPNRPPQDPAGSAAPTASARAATTGTKALGPASSAYLRPLQRHPIQGPAVARRRRQPRPFPTRTTPAFHFSKADAFAEAGQFEQALAELRAIEARFAGTPTAATAAFQQANILMKQLQNHGAAARQFEQARLLMPSGPLAEHALALEAQAWYRSGNLDRARSVASSYVTLFPQGIHRQSVEALLE